MTKLEKLELINQFKEIKNDYHEMIQVYEGLQNETLEVLCWYEQKIVDKENELKGVKKKIESNGIMFNCAY